MSYFEGVQLDPKFVVQQFMDLFSTLPTKASHPEPEQASGTGKFRVDEIREILTDAGVDQNLIDRYLQNGRPDIWVPQRGQEPLPIDDNICKQKVYSSYQTWLRRYTKSLGMPPLDPPPLEPKDEKDAPRPGDDVKTPPPKDEPTLKIDPGTLDSEAKVKIEPGVDEALFESYAKGKTERLFSILKDRYNFKKSTKLPAGLLKDFMSAFGNDAEEDALQQHATKLEEAKVKEDDDAKEGKKKKELEEEDLRKKAFALLQRSTVIRKKLFQQAQGALPGKTDEASKASLEQFKVRPHKKGKKGGKKSQTAAESIDILI